MMQPKSERATRATKSTLSHESLGAIRTRDSGLGIRDAELTHRSGLDFLAALRARSAKCFPRSSKFEYWSKEAQAGERRTVSPGRATAAARVTARSIVPALSISTTPASAFSMVGAASPI